MAKDKKKKKKRWQDKPLESLRNHLRRKDNVAPMSKYQKRNDRLKSMIDNLP